MCVWDLQSHTLFPLIGAGSSFERIQGFGLASLRLDDNDSRGHFNGSFTSTNQTTYFQRHWPMGLLCVFGSLSPIALGFYVSLREQKTGSKPDSYEGERTKTFYMRVERRKNEQLSLALLLGIFFYI